MFLLWNFFQKHKHSTFTVIVAIISKKFEISPFSAAPFHIQLWVHDSLIPSAISIIYIVPK